MVGNKTRSICTRPADRKRGIEATQIEEARIRGRQMLRLDSTAALPAQGGKKWYGQRRMTRDARGEIIVQAEEDDKRCKPAKEKPRPVTHSSKAEIRQVVWLLTTPIAQNSK